VNYRLFEMINSLADRADNVDDIMEFAATWLIYAVFAASAGVVGVALYRRRLRPVLELGTTLVLAFAMAAILGRLSSEQRPFQSHQVHQLIAHGPGVSMPSDHATAAFALAFGIYAFVDRRWGLAFTAAALLIGLARVWSGVHYPGDILAGTIIAALAALEVVAFNHRAKIRPPSSVRP
jgi:undecaprenyl-diphosphatase